MVQSQFGHIVFGIKPTNIEFYKQLLEFLGWKTIYQGEDMLGVAGPHGASLWFGGATKDVVNDYDGPGVNHVALSVPSQADVDAAAQQLTAMGVQHLFETPRHRPEFSRNTESTYYQVMFESPDRILFEIVYTGPKS